MRQGQRLLLLLRNNETAQSVAIAISVAGVIIGLVVLFLEWPPTEIRAAVSTNYSTIEYDKVNCVSIGPHDLTVEGKDIPDPRLGKFITDTLSIRSVLFSAAYSECPWTFFINIAPGTNFAVHDGVLPAQYLVSVGICERTDDGRPNAGKCVNKNVYVFNWRVKPRDLFRVAIVGLKPDTKDDEEFTVRAEHD